MANIANRRLTPRTRPLVSICIPARNSAQTIDATLRTVVTQNHPRFEVLVSDNRSVDDTLLIAGRFSEARTFKFPGPPDGLRDIAEHHWNFIWRQAQGEFVALYHADDLYLQDMVDRQAAFLEGNPRAAAVFTLSTNIDREGRPTGLGDHFGPEVLDGRTLFSYQELLELIMRKRNVLRTPTLMARRTALEAAGGFDAERFASSSDLDLWLRLARLGSIGVIPERLHLYRLTSHQVSAQVNLDRTASADFFSVVDHHLAAPDARGIPHWVRAAYEAHRSMDELLCINNLLVLGDRGAAARRYWSRFSNISEVLRGSRYCGLRFARLFLLTTVHLCAHGLGLGRWGAAGYKRAYAWNIERLRTAC